MSVDPHQFPGPGEVFLDHVAIFVDEFERSGSALERLGFVVTPFRAHESALRPGEPMTPLGTGNRCVMLRTGFVEILGPTADTPMAAQLRAQRARYDGLHLIAFTGHDAEAHHAALAAEGLAPLPIARLARTQSTPDGERPIRASIVRLAPEAWPEGRVQIVFPETPPEAMWHPALTAHPNRIERLSEALVVVADPAARAERFARFARRPARPRHGGRHVLELDRGRLHFVDADGARALLPGLAIPTLPFIAALSLGSADVDATRAQLAARSIPFAERHGAIVVGAGQALGATLLVHAPGEDAVIDRLAGA